MTSQDKNKNNVTNTQTSFVHERERWRDLEKVTDIQSVSDCNVTLTDSASNVNYECNKDTRVLDPDQTEFVPGEKWQSRSNEKINRKEPQRLCGKVEGISIEFLCDTGAESTILSIRCFEKLPRDVKMRFQDCVSSVTMPDGRTVVSKGPVLCKIEVGNRRVYEVICVSDIEDYAILGWDAQLALGVQYSVASIDLVGRQKLCRVFNPVIRRIQVAERCVVPPMSEIIVREKCETKLPQADFMIGSITDPAKN